MKILHPFQPNIEKMKKNQDTEGLVHALDHKDKEVQKHAIKALEGLGKPGIPHILQALKEKDKDIQKMAANSLGRMTNEAVVIIRGGLIKLSNKKTNEITGYTEREIIGKKFYDFIDQKDRGEVIQKYKKRLQNADIPSRYETALVSKEGKKIQVEINAALIKYEERPADLARIKELLNTYEDQML